MPLQQAPGMVLLRPLSCGDSSWSDLGPVLAWPVPAGCPVQSRCHFVLHRAPVIAGWCWLLASVWAWGTGAPCRVLTAWSVLCQHAVADCCSLCAAPPCRPSRAMNVDVLQPLVGPRRRPALQQTRPDHHVCPPPCRSSSTATSTRAATARYGMPSSAATWSSTSSASTRRP